MSLARHTAYNLAGQLVPLALSFFTLPAYLRLIGETRFGCMALLWLFVGYMGLFDFGIGQASARQLSRSDSSTPAEQSQVLWTALLLSLGLGVVGALVTGSAGVWFFSYHAAIQDKLRLELLASLPWAALVVPTVALASVLNGALQARKAFGEINLVGALTNALVLLAPLAVAASTSVELPWLVAAVAASRVLVLGLLIWCCWRKYRSVAPMAFDRLNALQLLRFGGWTTVSAIVGPMMIVLDRFAIGALLGARAVGQYTVPFQLAEKATLLSAALNAALFPRLAAATNDARRQELGEHAIRLLCFLITPAVAFGVLLIEPFLSWWVSAGLATVGGNAGEVLLLGFWANSLAMVPYVQLYAAERPDLVAKSHVVELLPYLALLYAGLQIGGLNGAATVFALRASVDFFVLAHLAGVLHGVVRGLFWPASALLLLLLTQTKGALLAPWPWVTGLLVCLVLLAWCARGVRVELRRVRDGVAGSC